MSSATLRHVDFHGDAPAPRSKVVLLVEDNPGDAELVSLHLAEQGGQIFEIVNVTNLRAAAEAMVHQRIDVVVLDLTLPDGQGLQVLEWARGVSDRVPVIIFSGTENDDLQLFAYDEGIQHFIRKSQGQLQFLAHNVLFALERFGVRKHREQLLKVVSENPDAMLVVSETGDVHFANDAAVSLFQQSREEFTRCDLAFAQFTEEVSEIEIERGDQKLLAEVHAVPIEWNEHRAFLATVRDVTRQRRTEERLLQKQKLEAVGTLAAGVAHDFNNVLTVVSGNLQLLQADLAEDPNAQQLIGEISGAVTRATNLVRQILTFSRKESELRVLTVDPIAREAVRFLRSALPANIGVVLSVEPKLPPVRANATQLQQVLVNLGTNAGHAMRLKGGTLEVTLKTVQIRDAADLGLTEMRPGRYLRIDVRDTGSGMDKKTLARIFEPFYTTKPAGEGTGLGLSIVHGILKAHGGGITVYSELNRGTIFRVYLPSVDDEAEKADAGINPIARGAGQHILCVDDEPALVSLLSRLLERLEYRVTSFTDSNEALRAFCENPNDFDAVVTDLSMPGLDGSEFAKRLLEVRSDLPIVMMTGFIQPEVLEEARELGIKEMLVKPDSLDELGSVLQRVLG